MKHVNEDNCIPYSCTCGIPSNVTFTFCGGGPSDIPGKLRQDCGTAHNTVGAGCTEGWEDPIMQF